MIVRPPRSELVNGLIEGTELIQRKRCPTECLLIGCDYERNISGVCEVSIVNFKHNTWEPEENILDERLIETFEEELTENSSKRGPKPKRPLRDRSSKETSTKRPSKRKRPAKDEDEDDEDSEDEAKLEEENEGEEADEDADDTEGNDNNPSAHQDDPSQPMSPIPAPTKNKFEVSEEPPKAAKKKKVKRRKKKRKRGKDADEDGEETGDSDENADSDDNAEPRKAEVLKEHGKIGVTISMGNKKESPPALKISTSPNNVGVVISKLSPLSSADVVSPVAERHHRHRHRSDKTNGEEVITHGSDYWQRLNPVMDQILVTDVTSGSTTVTIRECAIREGFFKSPTEDSKADAKPPLRHQ
ncbi:unnamed protein product [Notodromas monacha]|uniref:Uncharacterized protein n=1 Tax=Notodromas monacha TaxID=399045 RepID=A0A7R9BSS6_9CRUS|nr:unnamed protein product [Notodromas monacha]CAG0921068.1 unnamed protein product [Notodromas monacha]